MFVRKDGHDPLFYLRCNYFHEETIVEELIVEQEALIAAWLGLRSAKRETDRQIQLEECRKSIARLRSNLAEIGGGIQERQELLESLPKGSPEEKIMVDGLRARGVEMQQKQYMLQEARIREAELDAAQLQTAMTDAERALWVEDLAAIQRIPVVRAIVITQERLAVTVGPIIAKVSGRRFDLGDYDIDVAVMPGAERSVLVRCVRRSMESASQHPYNTDASGAFCAGARAAQITMLQKRGCYRQLIELVLECVHHVNPGGEDKVIGRYKEIEDEGVAIAAGENSRPSTTEDTRVLPRVPGGD